MARYVAPGVAHHITQRGTARQTVFGARVDRRVYLGLLREQARLAELPILAYCLMRNHIHLIVVPREEAQLAQVAATLPPLLSQLQQQRDLLARLSGGFPNQELAEKLEFSSLQLPRELPLTLPSQLVEQRPDVR